MIRYGEGRVSETGRPGFPFIGEYRQVSWMATIRVGLIGAGLLGLTHSVSLLLLKNAGLFDLELVSVYDPERAAAESLAKNIGFGHVAQSAREIVGDDTVDTVYIATPTLFHHDYVIDAARAGKNIFCEKPLFIDLPGAGNG